MSPISPARTLALVPLVPLLFSAACDLPAGEIDIVLENGRGAAVDVMATDFRGHPGWFTVENADGEELQLLDDCGICNCADLNMCAVCGMAMPEALTLEEGDKVDFHWSGTAWSEGVGLTQPCESEHGTGRGPFSVELCWGEAISADGNTELDPASVECESRSFTLGEDSEVHVVIE